jgi:LPS-assembly lipoprotein
MSWSEAGAPLRGFCAAAAVLVLAGLTGGCAFQPLYGEQSAYGTPALGDKLSAVSVHPIDVPNGTPEARVGLELRNALIFDLTGGSAPAAPTHELKISLRAKREQIIVDVNTARPDVETYGIDVTYSLTDLASGKPVVTSTTFARVSYDIPGQEQRFARQRGLRDAENRAAKVIASQIRTRLASYFVAGT